MRITTKLTLIISVLLIILFTALGWSSYRRDQEMALNESVDKARTIAHQIIETREYLSSVIQARQVEQNFALTPQVAATRIALRLTKDTPYYVRQVSLRYRNQQNQPDAYERTVLEKFTGSHPIEHFQLVGEGTKKSLRYLLPMVADQSCLACHGSFETAPGFVQERFPKGHPSYNYTAGELIGAISVTVPVNALHQTILKNITKELALEGSVLLIILLVTGWTIHRFILKPVSNVAQGIERVISSGVYTQRIEHPGSDEISHLVTSFNELMAELERRTLQRAESDERYRNFIEIAQSPIITFLSDGKIVIANQKAEKLFGLTKKELLGQSIYAFLADPERLKAGISDYFLAGSNDLIGTTSRQTVRDICGRQFDVEMVISVSQTDQEAMFTGILRTVKG